MIKGKKRNDIFSIGMCLLFICTAYSFYLYNQKRMRFDGQALGVNLEEFKAKWGAPKKQFVLGGDLMVFYDCDNFQVINMFLDLIPKSTV